MHPERFHRLGPEAALEAAEAAGVRASGRVSPLRLLENRVWDVELEDGAHVVVKFYRPGRWPRAAVEDEHRFLEDLRAAEIPVCAPLRLEDATTVGEHGGVLFGVWPRTGGREPDELDDGSLEILGRLLARMHAVGATRDAPSRPVLTPETGFLRPLEILEAGFVPTALRTRYRDAARAAADTYAARLGGVRFQRIHGDCHLGNLLRGREGWFFLDFDDFVMGPAVHDVWMLVPARDAEGARQRAVLLDAYRQFHDFDPRELELVEPLRAMRFLRMASWVASRWDEPAFRSTFPHFGTAEYWEREAADLEDQVARIGGGGRGGPAPGPAAAGGEEADPAVLTNADYFWDL